jgi:hypothetical protein
VESTEVVDSNRTTCRQIVEICGDAWKEERRVEQRSIIFIYHRQRQRIVRSMIEKDCDTRTCSDDNNP